MTEPDNARGYAFVAFQNAHTRQLRWSKYAAAAKHGYYPSMDDYIEEGLMLFDRMYATATPDIETMQDIVDTIVRSMAQSIDEEFRGHFQYITQGRETEYITTRYDVTLDEPILVGDGEVSTKGGQLAYIEPGYGEADDADLMRMRMSIIAQRLSEEDMAILTAYIDGEYDSIAAACGDGSGQAYIKRMRNACASLEGSLVFG